MLLGRSFLMFALVSLVACDSGVREGDPGGESAEQGGGGDAGGAEPGGGGADAGGTDTGGAGGTDTGGANAGGAGAAVCPEQQPELITTCSDAWLRCEYVGDDGCPLFVTCFEYLSRVSWVETAPRAGGACDTPGQFCEYDIEIGDSPESYYGLRCGESGTWESDDLCPEALPEAGAPCEYRGHSCQYDVCGGDDGAETSAYCSSSDRTWDVRVPCDPQ